MLQQELIKSTLNIKIESDIHFEHLSDLERDLNSNSVPVDIEKIHIDLSKVRFIDSSGVGFLIIWLHPLSEKYSIEFSGASEHVKKILNICKIDQFTTII